MGLIIKNLHCDSADVTDSDTEYGAVFCALCMCCPEVSRPCSHMGVAVYARGA